MRNFPIASGSTSVDVLGNTSMEAAGALASALVGHSLPGLGFALLRCRLPGCPRARFTAGVHKAERPVCRQALMEEVSAKENAR